MSSITRTRTRTTRRSRRVSRPARSRRAAAPRPSAVGADGRFNRECLPARFAVGAGLVGPDAYGCIGTGIAPAILRGRDGYYVGPEIYVHAAARAGIVSLRRRVYDPREMRGNRSWRVYCYRTRAAAVAKFAALVEARVAENRRLRDQHAADRAAAAKGDMAAAARLLDY